MNQPTTNTTSHIDEAGNVVINLPAQPMTMSKAQALDLANRVLRKKWKLDTDFSNQILNNDNIEHVIDIICIYLALKTIFPKNDNLQSGWITATNTAYGNQTHLSYLLANGTHQLRHDLEVEAYIR